MMVENAMRMFDLINESAWTDADRDCILYHENELTRELTEYMAYRDTWDHENHDRAIRRMTWHVECIGAYMNDQQTRDKAESIVFELVDIRRAS